MKYWLTSDLHLGHFNIIRYCGRPFKTLDHMNTELVRRWNERISDEDVVYHIGDFCFKNSNEVRGEGQKCHAMEWIEKLHGQKVFLRGNHDKNNSLRTLTTSCVLEFAGENYFLTHRPDDANVKFKINFTGHCHERWHYKSYKGSILINVGVDVNSFYPKTIEETLKEYKHWIKNNALEEYVPWKGGNA
jgi:calcineurin-like phosphoesterase family protein